MQCRIRTSEHARSEQPLGSETTEHIGQQLSRKGRLVTHGHSQLVCRRDSGGDGGDGVTGLIHQGVQLASCLR
jgi:hypothetical protein